MAVVSVRTVQTLAEPEDISMSDMSLKTTSHLPATVRAPPSFTSCPVQSMWHFILFSIFFFNQENQQIPWNTWNTQHIYCTNSYRPCEKIYDNIICVSSTNYIICRGRGLELKWVWNYLWVDQKSLNLIFMRVPFTEQPQNSASDQCFDHKRKKITHTSVFFQLPDDDFPSPKA